MRVLLWLPCMMLSACMWPNERMLKAATADFVVPATLLTSCPAATAYSTENSGVAMLVIQNGVLLCESYAAGLDRTTPHALFSGTKGLNGLMAAAAAHDGLLTLDEKVADTIPEWRNDELKSQITIRALLALSSGLQTSGPRAAPGYAEAAATPAASPSGSTFAYGPIVFQVFGEVLRRKLAMQGSQGAPIDYLARRVLEPIGAKVTAWGGPTAGQDPNLAAGAQMSASDWARVGMLMLQPDLATSIHLDPEVYEAQMQPQGAYPGYGLTWWLATSLPESARERLDPVARSIDLPQAVFRNEVPSDLVVAAGAGGQRLYISRSRKLVAVRFADDPDLAARLQALRTSRQPSAAVSSERFSDTEFVKALLADLGMN